MEELLGRLRDLALLFVDQQSRVYLVVLVSCKSLLPNHNVFIYIATDGLVTIPRMKRFMAGSRDVRRAD